MKQSPTFRMNKVALAAATVFGTTVMAASQVVSAAPVGHYVAGDFHNHTTCSDGSISMQKLIGKSTDKTVGSFGLDWFVQAGHGGSGNRNCTLVEDASLSTPVYPVTSQGPTTTWQSTTPSIAPKGLASGTAPNRVMWRWQSLQEFQYPVVEYLGAYKNVPLFIGVESVVAGHEHSSMSVITGQIPLSLDNPNFKLPTAPVIAPNASRYTAKGNANALAQWEYCFDRADSDTSRGNSVVGGTIGNNWNCGVTGSLNSSDPSWSTQAQKLIPASGAGTGTRGHNKTVEAMKWMAEFQSDASYYIPAHLERAGPFNPDGNNGYNIEHLRDFNNAAPKSAFGMETQPGHGASADRGEYAVLRNGGFTGSPTNVDSVGGTTYGGTGVYGAQIGGVWDALLGEGRNFWFFASSDWHNRGSFGPDDRRSTQDFLPGEYQRNYTLAVAHKDKLRPTEIVNGLRSGNNFASSGQLVDRMSFIACVGKPQTYGRVDASVARLAIDAASNNVSVNAKGCATMGEKLVVPSGADVVVAIAVRDPDGANNSPYTFNNPSLAQVGITQAINMPVLDHIDLIRGMVTGYKTPGAPDYSGEWPRNLNWLHADGTTADLSMVPDAAKNTSASVLKTFTAGGSSGWKPMTSGVDGSTYLVMTYHISAVTASQYVRLRGTNMPAAVPYETDANGNPLADVYTNASNPARLTIPCTTPHSANSQFDGCPDHLATATAGPISGMKAVSFDVAAWSDLWFYSNPVYVEVDGSTVVAGVN